MAKTKDNKVRHAVESLISAFLFVFQHIPVVGPWMGPMCIPFATYILSTLWVYPDFLDSTAQLLFFSGRLMFGRIVAIAGLVIFLIALIQFINGRGRLVRSGLYSVVRHPQYFGITVIALGISMMCIQYSGLHPKFLNIWLIQIFGYVLLASYEERHVLREYEKEYSQYKQKVSFILPIPRLTRIPESVSTMMVALIVAFLLTLL